MGLFSRFFKKKETHLPDFLGQAPAEDDFTYVLTTAELISGNDASVMEKVRECIDNTSEYAKKNEERYNTWAITDTDKCDRETLILTGMIDELTEGGYLYTADTSTEFDDFADGITELSTYKSMNIDISEIEFDPDRNALEWCRIINEELIETRQICCIDIGGEDLNLVWLDNETIEEIADAVENTEISIEAVGLKQY